MGDAVDRDIGRLTKAARGFLTSQLWADSPRRAAALSADVGYRPARQISDAGLAERETDRKGTAWYYLNQRGWKARARLQQRAASR